MNEKSVNNRLLSLWSILAVFAMAGLYLYQGYVLERDQFLGFISSYILLFGLYLWICQNLADWSFKTFLIVAIGLRLIFIVSVPVLSNDFFRFIWDGELITQGINPFAHKPDDLISFDGFLDEQYMRYLYHGMGELSQQHFSCYPPVNQLLFLIPAWISDDVMTQLVIYRLEFLLAEIGIIWVGKKLLEELKLPINRIWLFALNPLVIIELTGNLHFEAPMLFFLLAAVYLLVKKQWVFATVFFTLAVHTKLIPLIILPVLIKSLGIRRTVAFGAISGILILLLGNVFLTQEFFGNMFLSIHDYFVSFEFNASFFYILREIGFAVYGYDMILTYGPFLGLLSAIVILLLAIFVRNDGPADLLKLLTISFTVYYLFATTVHPWYITTILLFSVFVQFKYVLVWSLLIMLSYSAYQYPVFAESMGYVLLEYTLVFVAIFLELRQADWKNVFRFQKLKILKGVYERA